MKQSRWKMQGHRLFARDCGAACDGIAEGINRRSFDSASAVAKDATKSKGADAALRMTILRRNWLTAESGKLTADRRRQLTSESWERKVESGESIAEKLEQLWVIRSAGVDFDFLVGVAGEVPAGFQPELWKQRIGAIDALVSRVIVFVLAVLKSHNVERVNGDAAKFVASGNAQLEGYEVQSVDHHGSQA
jgi:hypothetical protein